MIQLNNNIVIHGTECTHAEQLSYTDTEVSYNLGYMVEVEGVEQFQYVYGIFTDLRVNSPFEVVEDENDII